MAVDAGPERALMLGDTDMLNSFAEDFSNCYWHLPVGEVAQFAVLPPEECSRVWRPDAIAQALTKWRSAAKKGMDADREYQKEVAAEGQDLREPRVFLYQFTQLGPELFPIQYAIFAEMLYADLPHTGVYLDEDIVERSDFYYSGCYRRIAKWLRSLPVHRDTQVYVARFPLLAIRVRWREFVRYWDAFYCNRFCTLNVCDEPNQWFLSMHQERGCVFGCTEEYGSNFPPPSINRMRMPVDYQGEIRLAINEFSLFQSAIRSKFISKAEMSDPQG